jgi:hypothetical protein
LCCPVIFCCLLDENNEICSCIFRTPVFHFSDFVSWFSSFGFASRIVEAFRFSATTLPALA